MNKTFANIAASVANLHVGLPSLLGFLLAAAAIIWPKYSATLTQIAVLGMSYGIIAAGNSNQSVTTVVKPTETTNTTTTTK